MTMASSHDFIGPHTTQYDHKLKNTEAMELEMKNAKYIEENTLISLKQWEAMKETQNYYIRLLRTVKLLGKNTELYLKESLPTMIAANHCYLDLIW
jgi:hypothetical protein